MVFFAALAGNFDLASFSFQVPIWGLAKQSVKAAKQVAIVIAIDLFLMFFSPSRNAAVVRRAIVVVSEGDVKAREVRGVSSR